MAAVSRDTLCNIGTVQIPRPKCNGFQFVPTRGRMGFYRSMKRDGEKYGIQMKNMGPRRPQLPDATFWKPPPSPSRDNNESQTHSNDQRPQAKAAPHIDVNHNHALPPRSPTKVAPAPTPPQKYGSMATDFSTAVRTKAARLPPKPPKIKTVVEEPVEPPVDYDEEDFAIHAHAAVEKFAIKRQAPLPPSYISNRKTSTSDRF